MHTNIQSCVFHIINAKMKDARRKPHRQTPFELLSDCTHTHTMTKRTHNEMLKSNAYEQRHKTHTHTHTYGVRERFMYTHAQNKYKMFVEQFRRP